MGTIYGMYVTVLRSQSRHCFCDVNTPQYVKMYLYISHTHTHTHTTGGHGKYKHRPPATQHSHVGIRPEDLFSVRAASGGCGTSSPSHFGRYIYYMYAKRGRTTVLYMCTYTNMHRVVERVALLMYILYVCIYVYQVYVVSILH